MTSSRRALLAAAAVEASAGLAAASWANALGGGRQPVPVFVACTLAVAVADMVLVPGHVWASRPRMALRLVGRTIAAALTLVAAVWVAIWATAGVLVLGSLTVGASSLNDPTAAALLGVSFLVAGVIVGLGAAVAERADWHPGAVKARWTSHLVGGVAGVLLVLALALMPVLGDITLSNTDQWWPLLVLAPVVLVLGGGVHNALMARDAARTGTALADPGRWPGGQRHVARSAWLRPPPLHSCQRDAMDILLVNPPYISLTSAHGVGHQVPLGLLCIGGPLIDAGHTVRLLDAERRRLTGAALAEAIGAAKPDIVMTGHAGSTPAHPACLMVLAATRSACPAAITVYGGPYPTYHAADVLAAPPEVDVIVRGEGEAVALALVTALAAGGDLADVAGLAVRRDGTVVSTPAAPSIADLNAWRVGWELIGDWDLYQCFGLGRAAIVQFSRGCPHTCSYCGQYQFWTRWRFRDPARVAAEIAWLHRTHGVMFVDLADENPTSSKRMWRSFLEALVAEDVPVKLFATIRATDIVRDADLLPLARRAGLICVLIGIETTDTATLAAIRKGSTVREDQRAVALLRQHGILSMLGHIVGFEEERAGDAIRATRQVMAYDPDLLNAMYVTPHRWSDWTAANGTRQVVQEDVSRWDYRHQLLATRYLAPWQMFALVKLMEVVVHLRPRALWRVLAHPDRGLRQHLRWCFRNSARVWLAEVAEFISRTPRPARPMTLAEWFAPGGRRRHDDGRATEA